MYKRQAFYGDFQPNNPDAYKVLEGEFTPEQYAVGIKKGANALACLLYTSRCV